MGCNESKPGHTSTMKERESSVKRSEQGSFKRIVQVAQASNGKLAPQISISFAVEEPVELENAINLDIALRRKSIQVGLIDNLFPSDAELYDHLYRPFADEVSGLLNIDKFLSALEEKGISRRDQRLQGMFTMLEELRRERHWMGSVESMNVDKEMCQQLFENNRMLFTRALANDLVIPDFHDFCEYIEHIYWKCKGNTGGKTADYIPQLAKFKPEYWGVSVCTVDGQRYSIGDTTIPYTIQSSGKPISYAIALNELGEELVHRYVGQEPSGRVFNELVLDHNRKPHNPMVNAGAIIVSSLLQEFVNPDHSGSDKFDWLSNYFSRLCGNEYIGFSNTTFLSEREAADRNFAIAYYMKENKCFPPKAVLKEVLNYYFQMCSLEMNCQSMSVMAATLANGGMCPMTSDQVLNNDAVRDTLSLMHSCGMYDYSGQFAFSVGLPTKSGVSGVMMVVVPNVMGVCLWSPPLDSYGNSVRGVQFCQELVNTFNFHPFDNLFHSDTHKLDPRQRNFSPGSPLNNKTNGAANGHQTWAEGLIIGM